MNSRLSSGSIASLTVSLRGGTEITYFVKRDVVQVRKLTEDGYKIVDAEIPVEDFIKLCEDLVEGKKNV